MLEDKDLKQEEMDPKTEMIHLQEQLQSALVMRI